MFFSYYFYHILHVNTSFNYRLSTLLPMQNVIGGISIQNNKLLTKHVLYFFKTRFLLFSFSNFFFKVNSFFFFINKINYYYFQLFFFKNFRFLKNFFFFLKINNKRLFILDIFYKKVIKNVIISMRIIFYELRFIH